MFTDEKWQAYDDYQGQHKLLSVWSMYNVDNFDDVSGIAGKQLVYAEHWGDDEIRVDLPQGDLTWGQLWAAADRAIRLSGDHHHVFIEQLDVRGGNVVLRTGS